MESPTVRSQFNGNSSKKAYGLLCETNEEAEYQAHETLGALKKEVQRYGNEPIKLGIQIAIQLEKILTEPLFKPIVDWYRESEKISSFAQQTNTNPRSVELMEKAGKQILIKLQKSKIQKNLMVAVTEQYVKNIYKAEFEQKIKTHHFLENRATVITNLENIWPYIEKGCLSFAQQIVNTGDVSKLKRPPREPVSIDLNEVV